MELVLLHESGQAPSGTSSWLALRPRLARHHHIRPSLAPHMARLSRWLAGRAVGVVLSGGGSRGLAHLGVLWALDDAGVPIDAVGGTSQVRRARLASLLFAGGSWSFCGHQPPPLGVLTVATPETIAHAHERQTGLPSDLRSFSSTRPLTSPCPDRYIIVCTSSTLTHMARFTCAVQGAFMAALCAQSLPFSAMQAAVRQYASHMGNVPRLLRDLTLPLLSGWAA